MKKYQFIFSVHTFLLAGISFLSAYISLHYQLTIFVDFLIAGAILAFPISFALREAFRRRERALQYLSQFKSVLQSVYYCFESSKLSEEKKNEVRNILTNISETLLRYLSGKNGDHPPVEKEYGGLFAFIQKNEENLKGSFSIKIFTFYFRVNESIEFLLATKRHQTPWGLRLIVLVGIYMFVIFYPASLLHRTGFQVALWYIFVMTFFKALIFICLYNIQYFLEDPFRQNGPDSIRLHDFQFSGSVPPTPVFFETGPAKNEDVLQIVSAAISAKRTDQAG